MDAEQKAAASEMFGDVMSKAANPGPIEYALKAAAGVQELNRIAVAYGRIVGAIDQLKKRAPYEKLEEDLVAVLKGGG
jgi:hypothetical protein